MFAEKESTWTLLDTMKAISVRHGVSVSSVALRWLLQRPCVASIIIGARTMAHLDDNCTAACFELSEQDMTNLCELSRVDIPYPYEMIWRACRGSAGRLDDQRSKP